MRRLFLALLLASTSMLLSCGGGSSIPATHDLAGLEGIWDYNMVCSGILSGSGGKIPFNMDVDGIFTITRNSIMDGSESVTWSYDGATLSITEASNETIWDPTCGNEYMTGLASIIIPIAPGATLANIGGNMSMDMVTDFCGDATGSFKLSGTMSRR